MLTLWVAPLGSAARPVISNGKVTEEARRKEEESAKEKKRMRRRLRREEERGKKQAAQADRNARALSDSDESEDEESEDEAEALVLDDDGWQDTDDASTVDDLADTLARQFAEVQIRPGKKAETFATPARAAKPSLASGKKARQEPALEATPIRRKPEYEDSARPTPKQAFKTPLREMTKAPQSWETLINTPADARTGGKAKTPKVGMTPKGAERGEENSVPVQGADRALRYLTPRPCHK